MRRHHTHAARRSSAAAFLHLLHLQPLVQHADRDVDLHRLTLDDDQPLVRVDGTAGLSGCARVGHADLTLRLGADLVDLDAAFADD